jgi:UDP-N-acetylmuramoyl-tripeptide--D-alanyl-D-alanine ligase
MFIFLTILGILWIISVTKSVLFWVYLWQLKEYHIGRFIDHFRTAKGKSLLVDKFRIAKILLFVLYSIAPVLSLILILLIYFIELKKSILKPVFTLKTVFLVILSLGFVIIFAFSWIPLGLLLSDIFLPLIVTLFVAILKPVTYYANRRLLNRAGKKRAEFKDLIVIGITGSYGKTSTKEILYQILSDKFRVLKTEKNNNAEVGIAKTILNKLDSHYQVFIAEIGAYNVGKIREVCRAIKPTIGILTGVNEQHMATFGSQENIIKAKHEIFEELPADGIKIEKKTVNLRATDVIEEKENLFFKINGVYFRINVLGKHNLDNILLAIDCAVKLGMSLQEISKACLKIKDNKIIGRNPVIIDNSYSANPTGVIFDIEYLKLYTGKKAVVMPCLIELGQASKDVHQRIGKKLNKIADLAIITSRDWFEVIHQECPKAIYSDNAEEIVERLKGFNVIFVEGRVSRKIMEKIRCL